MFYFYPENWGRFPFGLIFFNGLKPPTRNSDGYSKAPPTTLDGQNLALLGMVIDVVYKS